MSNKNVADLRKEKQITQKQLAEMSGVNIRQIQKLEARDIEAGNMTAKNLLSIANVLGVKIDDLI